MVGCVGARVRMSDDERRARLAARHHLGRTAGDVVGAVRGVVALHSSDPITPHLSGWARVPGFTTQQLDGALYDERALWRLHAMRRTLFVVPANAAAVFAAAVGRDIAARERRRLEQWLAAEMQERRVRRWLARVEDRLLEVLADGREWRTQELSAAVPELATELTLGSGRWTTRAPLSSRLLFLMAMDGHVVRTRPAGSWRSSQYRWASTTSWFGRRLENVDAATGRAELARRYLAAHGPATLNDLCWWSGWSAGKATSALRDVDATTAALASGGEGFVLPDDVGPVPAVPPTVALLPGLDSTTMGWKERAWYLGAHGDRLFDRNGNAGPTVWVDGRVVGGWAQRPSGEVVYRLLEDVGAEAAERVAAEAGALTEWMAGVVAAPRFRTALERELSA
jgi:hypothetical protein